MPTDKARPGKD